MYDSEPTPLETVILQAANDIRVTAFGQRTRAALRRNREAQDDTLLPFAQFKDIPGPDLVRHHNALSLLLLAGNEMEVSGFSDRELLSALLDPLDLAKKIVAAVWPIELEAIAREFIDFDNMPIPFCTMYPNAREYIGSKSLILPQPLGKIARRLRDVISQTEVGQSALNSVHSVSSSALSNFRADLKEFNSSSAYYKNETILQWHNRIQETLSARRDRVPRAWLDLNNLIHTSVSAMISLAAWEHKLDSSEVISHIEWEDGDSAQEDLREWDVEDGKSFCFYCPEIPDGRTMRIEPKVELILPPCDTAIELQHENAFAGIVSVKGGRMSWSRDSEFTVELSVVRIPAYCVPHEKEKD